MLNFGNRYNRRSSLLEDKLLPPKQYCKYYCNTDIFESDDPQTDPKVKLWILTTY